ncbi:MAG: hypothetical protein AB8I08_22005 [Sandaracinaceae bacterium]
MRRGTARCPFCQAKRAMRSAPSRPLGRTRLALAGGAALMLAACGDPEPPPDETVSSGGETVQSDTMQSDTVQSDTVQSDTVQSDTVQSDTVQSDTVQSDPVQSDTGDVANGEVGGPVEVHEEEVSCAGRCGSHHSPPCMSDPDPCPAPPYGAPPADDTFV